MTVNAEPMQPRRKNPAKPPPKRHRVEYPPGFVLPTRREAERDPAKFYQLVDFLRNRREKPLRLSHVSEALGCDPATASRKLTERRVKPDERQQIIDAIYSLRLIYGSWIEQVHAIPHNLFYSMMDFFDIKETSQDNARGDIIGTYRLWRYSAEHEGDYVLGKIIFDEDHKHAETGRDATAVRVQIRQVRRGSETERGAAEVVDGYLFRISNMYVMLVREQASQNLRCTIFKDYRSGVVGTHPNSVYKPDTNHLVSLDGFAMGMDGNRTFVSPVYVELVDDKDEIARLDATLDVLPESKVPNRILKKLKPYPRIVR